MKTKYVLVFLSIVFVSWGCYALSDNETRQEPEDNATISVTYSNTLILYYSKTGKTKVVAESLCEMMPGAKLVEVRSDVSIPAAIFWYKLPFTKADIEPLDVDFENYEQIFLCTPVYMQGISPPIKTVIKEAPLQGKKAAVFATCGGFYGSLMHGLVKGSIESRGAKAPGVYVVKVGGKTDEEIKGQTAGHLNMVLGKQ